MIDILVAVLLCIFVGLILLYIVARVISAGIFRSWWEIKMKEHCKKHYKEKEGQNGEVQ